MMWCRRPFASSLLAASSLTAVISVSPSVASAADTLAADDPSVASLKIEVRGPRGASDGTCVLIHQTREGDIVLGYFLTAQRLFDSEILGTWRPHELQVRVFLDDTVVEADGSRVRFPAETEHQMGLALIGVPLPRARAGVAPILNAPPDVETAFVLRPFSRKPLPVGDAAGSSGNCLGAPAIADGGVLGIAIECAPGRPPVITRLSAARTFLARVLPAWQPSPAASSVFSVQHRNVDPFLNGTGCEQKTTIFDVPVHLNERETILGATAIVSPREGVSLGEVTVMSFDDRVVRLRFSMPADRSAWQTELCGADHALVTVGVNILVMRR